MRRFKQEITDKEELTQILDTQTICRLAMNTGSFPYLIPLNYGHKEGVLYFHCAKEGRKIDLLKEDNRVGFEIEGKYNLLKGDVACEWTSQFASIIGTGEVHFIEEMDEKREALEIIMQQHGSPHNDFHEKALQKVLVLRLEVKKLVGKRSSR